MQKNSFSITWERDIDFTDHETGLTVRVNRSNHHPRKKYSYQIGRLLEDSEKLWPFIPVFVTVESGNVVDVNVSPSSVEALFRQVHAYIQRKTQEQENEIINAKKARIKRDYA